MPAGRHPLGPLRRAHPREGRLAVRKPQRVRARVHGRQPRRPLAFLRRATLRFRGRRHQRARSRPRRRQLHQCRILLARERAGGAGDRVGPSLGRGVLPVGGEGGGVRAAARGVDGGAEARATGGRHCTG